MNLDISTPALLFPAISLLFLAYTNRFLTTGQLIRSLGSSIKTGKSSKPKEQLKNLKKRMELIRWMQLFGGISLLFCTISMLFIFFTFSFIGSILFVSSLAFMIISLLLCIVEIYISTIALNIELRGIN